MKLTAPSFIIPATRQKNAEYLRKLVDEVELLFFDSVHDFDMPSTEEINALEKIDIGYSAHLPTDQDLTTDSGWRIIDAYISALSPLNVRRFILHPAESEYFISQAAARKNIILENTDFYGSFFDEAVSAGLRLCFDNAHAGDKAEKFMEKYADHFAEFHLQGIKDGKHHKSLEYLESSLIKSIAALAETNGASVCLEVFNEKDFLESYRIFKELI